MRGVYVCGVYVCVVCVWCVCGVCVWCVVCVWFVCVCVCAIFAGGRGITNPISQPIDFLHNS